MSSPDVIGPDLHLLLVALGWTPPPDPGDDVVMICGRLRAPYDAPGGPLVIDYAASTGCLQTAVLDGNADAVTVIPNRTLGGVA